MDDQSFLSAFESSAIPPDRWTHRDHLRVAFLYLRALSFDEALNRIRSGIHALNRANGIESTPTSGYHETITVAWARIVSAAVSRNEAEDFDSFAQRNPRLLNKELLRVYYSKEHILSSSARASFVEPDITPLPDMLEL